MMTTYDLSPAYGDVVASGDTPADLARRAARPTDRRCRSEASWPRDRLGRLRAAGVPDEMAHGEHPDAATTFQQAFEHAVALFDAQRFYEAHEFFAHIWCGEHTDQREADFWKGVTQVAIGCCHAERGNAAGAHQALHHATGYLAAAPACHHGIDVAELIAVAGHVADQTDRHGAPPPIDFPVVPLTVA